MKCMIKIDDDVTLTTSIPITIYTHTLTQASSSSYIILNFMIILITIIPLHHHHYLHHPNDLLLFSNIVGII